MIEKLLNLSDKEVKIPENKCIFSDDNLYKELFKDGELEAKKKYSKLEIQAMNAGATRIFKKKYEEHRKNLLKVKNGTEDSREVEIYDFPKLKMPNGYKFDLNLGILRLNDETCEFEPVFPQIVIIEERYINVDTLEEKNKILFLDRLVKKSLIVEAETLSNTRSITKLRNMGIMVTSENARELVIFLSELLAVNIFNIEPKDSISRVGWNKSEFIPYNSACVFDGESENKPLFDSICSAGDYEAWVDYTKDLRKRRLLRLQMAASFASPLIKLTGSLPFVFHLWGGTGFGKAQPLDTKIITPDGFKLMKDIKIGDFVTGEDGKSYKISGVFPQGLKDVYELTFSDGTTTRCCKEHLWKVSTRTRRNHNRGYQVISLEDMLKRPIKDNKGFQYKVPVADPTEYTENEKPPIDAYLLGALIGDGCLTLTKKTDGSKILYFNNSEQDIINKISKKLNDIGAKMTRNQHSTNQFYLAGVGELKKNIEQLNLNIKSPQRFIPEIYKKSSIETRLEILRGLVDTDGCVSKSGSISFCSHSEKLAMDVCDIVRSLGGRAILKQDKRGTFYVTIICNFIPFSSKKHTEKFESIKNKRSKIEDTSSMAITKVRKIEPQECQCIMVDSDDHTYLCDDFIVTHNTVGLMVAMSIWGDPSMGKMTRTMNMTQNSMMTTAAFLHSLPFAGDELQIIKNKWHGYDNLIMAITEGVDRGRMDGHVNRKLKEWACNFLFTGEEPCTTEASGGGTKNRVIELQCKEICVANGNDVVDFVKNNHGWAGETFINALSAYDIRAEFKKIFDELNTAASTEKQIMSLSLMLLADKIASEQIYNQEPMQASEVLDLLKTDAEVDIAERAYSYVNDLVSINAINFSENSIVNWGRISDIEESVVINTTALNSELEKQGYSLKAIVGKWIEKGYCLNPTEKSKLYKFGGKVIRGYKLKLQDTWTDEELVEVEKLPFEE